ncbi:MAG TPA: hypothetical protein VMU51_33720 [Mycobacteriales bacterium]|jgi:hypothetical protein|nr:hypothetical protein [Mycobacteriales bacterium]
MIRRAGVHCPRCGFRLEIGDGRPQVDCVHCGGCWQTDLAVAELLRWYAAVYYRAGVR